MNLPLDFNYFPFPRARVPQGYNEHLTKGAFLRENPRLDLWSQITRIRRPTRRRIRKTDFSGVTAQHTPRIWNSYSFAHAHNWWFASDVTAAILVYRMSFEDWTILLCKTCVAIFYCFVHQHRRLLVWMQSKNRTKSSRLQGKTKTIWGKGRFHWHMKTIIEKTALWDYVN